MKNKKHHIAIEFISYGDLTDIEFVRCHLRDTSNSSKNSIIICQNYANYGYCSKGKDCTSSHNIDDILDKQGCGFPTKKRKANYDEEENINLEVKKILPSIHSSEKSLLYCGHRAGFDAFMTGFVFAAFLETRCKVKSPLEVITAIKSGFEDTVNKIYLIGKDVPLIVAKGNFAKVSSQHKKKMEKLNI